MSFEDFRDDMELDEPQAMELWTAYEMAKIIEPHGQRAEDYSRNPPVPPDIVVEQGSAVMHGLEWYRNRLWQQATIEFEQRAVNSRREYAKTHGFATDPDSLRGTHQIRPDQLEKCRDEIEPYVMTDDQGNPYTGMRLFDAVIYARQDLLYAQEDTDRREEFYKKGDKYKDKGEFEKFKYRVNSPLHREEHGRYETVSPITRYSPQRHPYISAREYKQIQNQEIMAALKKFRASEKLLHKRRKQIRYRDLELRLERRGDAGWYGQGGPPAPQDYWIPVPIEKDESYREELVELQKPLPPAPNIFQKISRVIFGRDSS